MVFQGKRVIGGAGLCLEDPGICAGEDENVFTAGFILPVVLDSGPECERDRLLEAFGQLAAEGDAAVAAQGLGQLRKCRPQVVGCLIENNGAFFGPELVQRRWWGAS